MEFLQLSFSSDFMPHGFCYLWEPRILWLHVISDGLIALSYYCISIILIYFLRKNRDIAFSRIFWMFAAFILACGTTHLLEIWNVWHGNYLIAGSVKAITAVVSMITVAMLIPVVPKLISLLKRVAEKQAEQAEELSRQTEELRRSQQELEKQSLTLQSVLDSMAEGLVAADERGKFILWNAASERIIGMGGVDLPIADWSQHYGLYLPDTVTPCPGEQLPLARALRGEVSNTELFVRNPKVPQGAWLEASAGPLKDKSGVLRGGVVAFRDITQRKADEREIGALNHELENRVVERTAELQAANQELEAFSYSVSHDLRAPLRHIAGFSQILVEEFGATLDPGARRYLDRIQAGTRKMGLLVDELLNLARVGRHALHRQTTDLNPIVREVIAILEPESAGRQVEWRISDLPAAECDPVLVKQIFQNLLANALKFTRPRAQAVIEVSHQEEGGHAAFLVRDNGVGFNMKYADKLFGVFQRLHSAQEFEGTGVGLATVQRICQKHGGRVWAEAKPDAGAAFYFTLDGRAGVSPPGEVARLSTSTETRINGATAGGRS